MKIAHLLRKCNPDEWAGTETAVLNLVKSLRRLDVEATIFAPQIPLSQPGPFELEGFEIQRVKAFLPYWGLSEKSLKQLISIGGNLLSFELLKKLWSEPNLSAIHTHAMGLFGGSALTIARLRGIPLIVSIHGGALDIPLATRLALKSPLEGSFMWGKPFSFFLRARHLLREADLIITPNPNECKLLTKKYPQQKVVVIPHAIDTAFFEKDRRSKALEIFPELKDKELLLMIARIDPVKNQLWLIEQIPALLKMRPNLKVFLIGPSTDLSYENCLKQRISELSLCPFVELLGKISNDNPLYAGLIQQAKALILPSVSETFGLAILEAWACGTPVFASHTSGAVSLIQSGQTGWIFDLAKPDIFVKTLTNTLDNQELCNNVTSMAKLQAHSIYDINILSIQMKMLYQRAIDCK